MPIDITCDQCLARYHLKDEHAGQKLRCKQCGNVLLVPGIAEPATEPPVDRGYHPAFARDKFLMNQKRIAISEKYYVFDELQNPILFIERPAHFFRQLLAAFGGLFTLAVALGFVILCIAVGGDKMSKDGLAIAFVVLGAVLAVVLAIVVGVWLSPKRHISVYTDDTKQHRLLEILQDHKFNFIRATYTLQDPAEGHLGRFEKNYLYNMFRRRWYMYGPDQQMLMMAQEDSLIMSLMRRILPPIISVFIARTNFIIHRYGETQVVGEFNRKFTLFDKYTLDMTADRDHALDRRMAIALGVLLDTGERR